MPKKYFKRIMPDHDKIRNHKHLQVFGKLLHDANLWHLNRRSVSGAFANGLFMAFVPVPFQMILAAGAAIIFRVNLPLSVALVWLTNPLTMPPMFYGTYKLGAWLMGTSAGEFNFELSYDWLVTGLAEIWKPFLLGCFVSGTVASILGYITIRLLWRWHIVKAWKARAHSRKLHKDTKED
jgi:uncharacterized protein (DUF2062 family)